MKNYADNSSYQTQPHSTTVTVAHTCKKTPLNSRIFDFVFGKKRENTVYVAYNNSFSTSFPGVSNVYLSEAIILKWMSCYFVFFNLWKFSYCDQCLYFNTFLIKVIQELKDFGFKTVYVLNWYLLGGQTSDHVEKETIKRRLVENVSLPHKMKVNVLFRPLRRRFQRKQRSVWIVY